MPRLYALNIYRIVSNLIDVQCDTATHKNTHAVFFVITFAMWTVLRSLLRCDGPTSYFIVQLSDLFWSMRVQFGILDCLTNCLKILSVYRNVA